MSTAAESDDEVIDGVIDDRRRRVRDAGNRAEGERPPLERAGDDAVGVPRRLADHGDGWVDRHWSSRTLHRFGEAVAHSAGGLAAASAVLVWLAVGVVARFPDWWETVLYATSASVTLVVVFAIQHTQARQQSATHRKLDELLRAQPGADNELIAVEEAPDQELDARATLNLADRRTPALEPDEPPGR